MVHETLPLLKLFEQIKTLVAEDSDDFSFGFVELCLEDLEDDQEYLWVSNVFTEALQKRGQILSQVFTLILVVAAVELVD